MRETGSNTILIALAIIFVFTILTMIVIQSPLASNFLDRSGLVDLENRPAQAAPTPSPVFRLLNDTDVTSKLTLRNPALGFTLKYPAGWRKKETSLEVVISPSTAGLDLDTPQDSALWVGIPAVDVASPVELLADISAKFVPTSMTQGSIRIAGETWNAAEIRFDAPDLGGEGRAMIAATSQNEVGYFLVTLAPAEHWPTIQPTFQQIINSFQFTQQAVLRPTDATPPPTPTPTPTPVIYVVQSGDTLLGIAIRYGVDMEALATRNSIVDPGRLSSGQKLIIPTRR